MEHLFETAGQSECCNAVVLEGMPICTECGEATNLLED